MKASFIMAGACGRLAASLLLAAGPWPATASGEMELTLTVTAKGRADIAGVLEDGCALRFTARLVFVPDLVTGRYDKPAVEQYTFSASGNGHIMDIESWTYSGRQPPPGTVSLNFDPAEGRAWIGWRYLDDFVQSDPEGDGQGSDRLARTAIKMAEDDLDRQDGAGEVRFAPNAASFTASGNSQGTHSDILGHAEMNASYTLVRQGEDLEAVILKPRGYESWLPIAGPDQSLPGTNPVAVVAELRLRGTQAPPPVRRARFRFELVEVSKEPGLCLNAPAKAAARADFDLGLAQPGGIAPGSPRQRYETENLSTDAQAVVLCYDHGAFARLRVTAITDTGEEIPAHVEGDPGLATLTLPQDENDNRIADAWEQEQGTWGEVQNPKWDESNLPDDHEVNGDGISLYEKYRGFMFAGRHERLQARCKHVFVYDPDGLVHANLDSVMSFQTASFLRVRFVEDETWTGPGPAGSDKRIVNFNTSGHGHAVDQHALHVRMVNSKSPTLADDFQKLWKAKYGQKLNRNISAFYGFTYHDVTGGHWAEAPRSAFAIELYPWGIERISREYVKYHTFALAQFKDYDTAPADEQVRLLAEWEKLTDEHIRSKYEDWEEQNYLYLMAGTSHELGHGVGIDDLQAPHNGGPWSCYLRYLDWDFGPNPMDRMELTARWHHATHRPQEFCHDPTATNPGKGCYEQIHVTDRRGAGVAWWRSRDPVETARPASAGGEPASPTLRTPGTPAPSPRSPALAAASPPSLGLASVLEWDAPQAGDPLRLTVRLGSPAVMRTWTRMLLEEQASATLPPFPAIAADWADGLRLELSRVEPDGRRTVVLGSGPWAAFRRTVPADPGIWERRLGARLREFLTDPAAVGLMPGEYVLGVAWDGRNFVNPALLPSSGVVTSEDLHFFVTQPTNDLDRACHLRRLAFQAWDRGQLDQARQYGRAALGLAPDDAGREAVDNAFVVAVASLGLNDPLGAAQALQTFGGRQNSGASPEVRLQAHRFFHALAPSLRIIGPAADPGVAGRLEVLGHPGQTYEVQGSADLAVWTRLDRRLTTTTPYEVVDARGGDGGSPRFYRVLWLP